MLCCCCCVWVGSTLDRIRRTQYADRSFVAFQQTWNTGVVVSYHLWVGYDQRLQEQSMATKTTNTTQQVRLCALCCGCCCCVGFVLSNLGESKVAVRDNPRLGTEQQRTPDNGCHRIARQDATRCYTTFV